MGPQPTTIERVGTSALRVVWADGHESVYPWHLLRTRCPCAMCQPYEALGMPLDAPAPSAPPEVHGVSVKPVGRYAIHIAWSDGHMSGIYAYEYLRQLCPCEACRPRQFDEG